MSIMHSSDIVVNLKGYIIHYFKDNELYFNILK